MLKKTLTKVLPIVCAFSLTAGIAAAANTPEISSVSRKRLDFVVQVSQLKANTVTGYEGIKNVIGDIKMPRDRQGEKYVVRFKNPEELGHAGTVKMEYFTENSPDLFEQTQEIDLEKGGQTIIFRHTGNAFFDKGRIAHWKISVMDGQQVLCSRTSTMWPDIPGKVLETGKF